MYYPSVNIQGTIWLFEDDLTTMITGAVQADFAIRRAFDAAGVTAVITITEIDDLAYPGGYQISFTPTTISNWSIDILYANAVTRRWQGDYPVVENPLNASTLDHPVGSLGYNVEALFRRDINVA